MAERSHVKIAGADYSENMILERQLTVQCTPRTRSLSTKGTLEPSSVVRPLAAGTDGPGLKSLLAHAHLEIFCQALTYDVIGSLSSLGSIDLGSISVRAFEFYHVITLNKL